MTAEIAQQTAFTADYQRCINEINHAANKVEYSAKCRVNKRNEQIINRLEAAGYTITHRLNGDIIDFTVNW